jgi:BTB/POZ domain
MDEPHNMREQDDDPPPLDIFLRFLSFFDASDNLAMMIPPRPTQPSANLMNDIREYLSMDDVDQYAAGRFLTALGCQDELHEIGIMSPADFHAEMDAHCGSTAPKLSLLARSKLIEACKILHHGGDLDKLRNISDMVSFVVGDQRFTSSLATMCRVKGSYLECLFSGRHVHARGRCPDSGEFFIDRSSKYMPYILDYLHYGKVLSLPEDSDEKDMLAADADFYGLPDLCRALRGARVWTALSLSDRTRGIQDVEHQQRAQQGGPKLLHFDHCLIPLFNESERGFYACPVRFCGDLGEDDVELVMEGFGRALRVNADGAVTVESMEGFESNFNRQHPNMLHRIRHILSEEPLVM